MSIDNYHLLVEQGIPDKKTAPTVGLDSILPNHRTLVVIYNTTVEERVTRFIASLNTPETIKADVITVDKEGKVYPIYCSNPQMSAGSLSENEPLVATLSSLENFKQNYGLVIEVNRWQPIL